MLMLYCNYMYECFRCDSWFHILYVLYYNSYLTILGSLVDELNIILYYTIFYIFLHKVLSIDFFAKFCVKLYRTPNCSTF